MATALKKGKQVFPMYVGVILVLIKGTTLIVGVPHVCGGDPEKVVDYTNTFMCSPCMWG